MTTSPPHEVARLLTAAQRVLVVAHVSPDGDTIGSVLALTRALRQVGIEARPACADPVPPTLRFLPGSDEIAVRQPSDENLIAVLDASDLARVGAVYSEEAFTRLPVLNIDHHRTNLRYGTVNWVEERAATAEMVFDLLLLMGVDIDADIATCLLTGIVTDTRCFATDSTQPDTLRVAADLLEAGGALGAIAQNALHHRTLEMLHVWGAALADARLENGVLQVAVPLSLLRATGASATAVDGLANFLGVLPDARASVVLRELDDGMVDVSLRSAPGTDVSAVALALGGGGHPQAAGCQVPGTLDAVRQRVLALLTEREG